MFDNKDFSKNYNKLVSTELQLLKRWNTIMDVMLKSANMPTKKDTDEIYKELFMLKKQMKKINPQKKTRRKKNDAGT